MIRHQVGRLLDVQARRDSVVDPELIGGMIVEKLPGQGTDGESPGGAGGVLLWSEMSGLWKGTFQQEKMGFDPCKELSVNWASF